MRVEDYSRRAIEEKLQKMGDYVKIDFLSSCLKGPLDFDTRKFVLVKLGGIYEQKKMYLDAGKVMRTAADINSTTQNKITDFLKAIEFFIRAGNYEEAEISMKKSIIDVNEKQKKEVYSAVKEFYKTQARFFISGGKKNQATRAYERVLELEIEPNERQKIKEELMQIYQNLGKVREYYELKRRY